MSRGMNALRGHWDARSEAARRLQFEFCGFLTQLLLSRIKRAMSEFVWAGRGGDRREHSLGWDLAN